MKYTILLLLTACSAPSSQSPGGQDLRVQICEPLLMQCRFSDSEDCISIKATVEQGIIDQNQFNAFACREL